MADNPYLADADAAADAAGVPRSIFHSLINTESGWNAYAYSDKGAIGLTQLMPATAATLGVFPWNPIENLKGGAAYLKQMFQKFGNWGDALAAYNAGPGNIAAGKGYAKKVLTDAAAEEDATPVPATTADDRSWWDKAGDIFRGGPAGTNQPDPAYPAGTTPGPLGMPTPSLSTIEGKLSSIPKYAGAAIVVLILLTVGLIMLGVGGWNQAKNAAGVRT
jgi:hypothetical protein